MNTPSSNDGAKSSTGARLTPTMPQRPSSASSAYSRPKLVSHDKTPSPPLGLVSKDEVNTSDPKKASPLNTRLLSNLKSFNIEKSKYKHYGHQSSMNAQSLQQIMNQETPDTQPRKDTSASPASSTSSSSSSSMSEANRSPEIHIDDIEPSRQGEQMEMVKDPEGSKEPSSTANKFVIDESIAKILGIPLSTLKANYLWPYNVETLNEIVKLKVEQERTKQILVKQEFGSTIIDLLKMAQSMNINGDLIPLLFVNDDESPSSITELNKVPVDELKNTIKKFKEEPNSQKVLLAERAANSATFTSTKLPGQQSETLTPRSAIKRKYSESSQLPSFNETAENIRQSVHRTTSTGTISGSRSASPIKSPNPSKPITVQQTPHLTEPGTNVITPSEDSTTGYNVHRRILSDSSEMSAKDKEKGSPSNQLAKPFSWPASNPYSQQHSPNLSETLTPPVGGAAHFQQHSALQPQAPSQPQSQSQSQPQQQPQQQQQQQARHQPQQARQDMYPVYYTPAPPRGVMPGSSKQTGDLTGTDDSGHASNSSTVLGSPYSQKYQPYMYPNPYQPGSFIPQQPQYYYVSASPSGQLQSGSQGLGQQAQPQFVMPAPGMMVPPYHQVQYQYPEHERGINTTNTSPKEETASAPTQSTKKHKSSTKTSSINFMITTPKNPPAKKYNNSNKDKASH